MKNKKRMKKLIVPMIGVCLIYAGILPLFFFDDYGRVVDYLSVIISISGVIIVVVGFFFERLSSNLKAEFTSRNNTMDMGFNSVEFFDTKHFSEFVNKKLSSMKCDVIINPRRKYLFNILINELQVADNEFLKVRLVFCMNNKNQIIENEDFELRHIYETIKHKRFSLKFPVRVYEVDNLEMKDFDFFIMDEDEVTVFIPLRFTNYKSEKSSDKYLKPSYIKIVAKREFNSYYQLKNYFSEIWDYSSNEYLNEEYK